MYIGIKYTKFWNMQVFCEKVINNFNFHFVNKNMYKKFVY